MTKPLKKYRRILASLLMIATNAMGGARTYALISGSGTNNTFYVPNASSCSTSSPSGFQTLVTGNKLFYIGDSLTYHMVRGSSKPENYDRDSGYLLEKSHDAGYDLDFTTPPIGGTDSTDVGPRIIGPSVEAQGGVNVDYTIKHLQERLDNNIQIDRFKNVDIVVIGLGTNIEQKDFLTEINALIALIRSNNPRASIYWVDTYFTGGRRTTYQDVNNVIEQAAAASHFNIIHYSTAVATNPSIAPTAGGDGVHVDNGPDRKKKADWLVSQLPKQGDATQGLTSSNSGSYDPTSLTYPAFPDETALASSIEAYIKKSAPSSPWLGIPNIGAWLVRESKSRGINPMLVMGAGKQENNFGTVGNNPKVNNNFFGMKGGGGYIHFDTPQLGMIAFLDALKRNIIDKSHSSYVDVTNMYEYFSVHQTGQIHYPGDGMSLGDPNMPEALVSWDTPYNPGNYWKTAAGVISAITGVEVSPEIPPRGSKSSFLAGACNSVTNATDSSKYVTACLNFGGTQDRCSALSSLDCTANGGNAAIACTAISQLMNIPYSREQRSAPTNPSPEFLDCSALVGMAIYRTFGLDLHGMCSVNYKNNANFELIDIHSVQPGDMLGIGTVCTGAGGTGHISVVINYDPATKKLITVEASSTKWPSGFRGVGGPNGYRVGMKDDGTGNYEWAVRYIGPKVLQTGAL